MSHYLPVLIVSVAAGIPDDASFQPLPSGQVDYLSHEWQEEDVWRSWRNMTKQKNGIANGVRLENASWRTWWKQRNKLKTISPETLNWLKDSDVTWLYGPLHTATEWVPPPKLDRSRQNSLSSPSSSTNLDQLPLSSSESHESIDHNHHYSHHHTQQAVTKPILKHRTISEMLTSALAPGSGLGGGSGSGSSFGWAEEEDAFHDQEEEDDVDDGESDVMLEQADNKYEHSSTSQHQKSPSRPSLMHTKSDTNILRRFGTGAHHLRRKQAQAQAVPRVAAQAQAHRASYEALNGASGSGLHGDVGDASVRSDTVVGSGSGLSGSQRTTSSGNLVDMPILQAHATGFLPVMHVENPAFSSSSTSLHAPLSYFPPGSALRSHSGSSAGSSRSDSVEGPSRRFSESVVPTTLPPKRHITFNPYVEQCIALEVPKVKMRSAVNSVSGGNGCCSASNNNGVSFGSNGPIAILEDGAEVQHTDRVYEFDDSFEYVDDNEDEEAVIDDGYDQDEEDGLYEDVGSINSAALANSNSHFRSGLNDDVDEEDDEEDEDGIEIRTRPSIAGRYSASAAGIPRMAKPDNVSSSGRPQLRRTSTSTSHRSLSSEKDRVSIAYIAPTVLKPGSSGRGIFDDEDEDEDEDDEVDSFGIGIGMGMGMGMGMGVDPGITMYADGPYSYVYGASYAPGSYEQNEKEMSDFDGGREVTYHHRPPSSDELFGSSSVGAVGDNQNIGSNASTNNKFLSPPLVGSPSPTSQLHDARSVETPERHYFEGSELGQGHLSTSDTSTRTIAGREQGRRPNGAVIAEGGTIEIVDDVWEERAATDRRGRNDVGVPTVFVEDRGRREREISHSQFSSSPNDRRSQSSSLSPDSQPPTNPRIASLKSESNHRQQQQSSHLSDSRSTATPALAIPTPVISSYHQGPISYSPDTQDFSMLTPPDSSPSRSRGRSQCVSPVNGNGYVTSGSATSPSAFSSDSRSLSESRSESRGRSYTRGSSCSDPDRFNSRSRSSGGTGSPMGSVSPRVNGIGFNYGAGYGTHSGREIKDGRGVKLYRKTSEDFIGTRERERGRDRDRRLSESLSPPDVNANTGSGRSRVSNATLSPPTRNQSSSLLYQSYTVNNYGQQRQSNDLEVQNKPCQSPAMAQVDGKDNVDYTDGASSSSQSTVNGFVSTVVPTSIPEEDELRSSLSSPITPSVSPVVPSDSKIISSPVTAPSKSVKHSRSQTLPSPTSPSVSASNIAAPGIHSRSSSLSSPVSSQPSSPTVQEDVGTGSFVGRAADIMSSARGFLESLWN